MSGEVDDRAIRRSQYSTDASNYRVEPLVVVAPRDADDLIAISEVSRRLEVPLTMRGGGTSVAGNAIGTGIVVDTTVHMNRILALDPDARQARVQPGVLLSDLQAIARPWGLRFGPDPSTQSRATLGGMIGNNACGPHAVAFGRTSDNVVALDVIDGLGRRYVAGQGLEAVDGLDALVRDNLATLRTEFGRFGRQASGYSLEHLLPENGRSLAKALVGTEGTVAVILEATVDLVPQAPAPALVVIGYASMAEAADDVPRLMVHHPLAMEGMDARLVQVVRDAKGADRVPRLPDGAGWLLIEVGGDDARAARRAATLLAADASSRSVRILPAGPEADAIWRMRADGAGLAGRTPSGRQAWPGWEDAAVPPESLGAYLREFDALMGEFGVDGLPYGHFGDGCVHVRVDVPLEADGQILKTFVTRAAEIVTRYGGSLSGEHGDGRARSELLPLMYSSTAIDLFRGFKHLFDPAALMNPGVIVDPRPLEADLRRPKALPIIKIDGFAFEEDDGDFTKAVHRCVGVGKCRASNTSAGGFMCPSYQATADETHVTRGRARVLQDLTNGTFGATNWSSKEVHDALDLCLSCKACASDCPAGVDMARYKSEVLHRRYRRKLRPMSHYVLGWLPRWARLASPFARLINPLLSVAPVRRLVLFFGGMDGRRRIPGFAVEPFRGARRQRARRYLTRQSPRKVLLWVDSFAASFSPEIAESAMTVLADAGYEVHLPQRDVCCGLTWITTGQLTAAKSRLLRLLDELAPYAEQGMPIIGLEPSCTAVLRSDLVDLLPDDPRSHVVAAATRTVAEMLVAPDAQVQRWAPPDLSDVELVVQPHCHQYSVMGFAADRAILDAAGAKVTELAGCCGLAGNFGMERGHYETSVAVAELSLLPALRDAPQDGVFLADGFSCRTQAVQLADVSGMALVQLLADRINISKHVRRGRQIGSNK